MENQNVFLLGTTKYSDSDAIMHCYGKETGYCTYFSKGVYKSKKKAFLQPLLELNIVSIKGKGELLRASKIELAKNQDLTTNIKSNSIVFFISELLLNLVRHESQNSYLYKEIEVFGNKLEEECYYAHLVFLIQLLKLNGIAPLITSERYLNPESGHFEETQINTYFNAEISELWKIILLEDKVPYECKIANKWRKDLLESIMIYYQYHFPHFKLPKSLEIIRQLFEE